MPKRVLIVDDEDHIREVAQVSLESIAGWEVFTAGSPLEGIAMAAAQGFDAILLDVMMPEMDGPSTLLELQAGEATKGIPVIFLTAKVQSAERGKLDGLGAAGLIAKPFDPMTLADEVGAVLQWDV